MQLFESTDRRQPGFRLAVIAVAMAAVVIILGAFTRLVDAGLGCPDWPTCYGHLWIPNTEAEIATANARFADTPVETDKTWPEQVHRIFAAGLGVITLAILGFCWRFRERGLPLKLPLFIVAFIILQGAFGMWTVTLKLWPQVVTAHLLGGFTMISLLWLLALRLGNYRLNEHPDHSSLKPLAVVAFLVVFGQIALGGWTTSNYAAVACPDFPTCQNQWLPPMDFDEGFNLTQTIGPNYLGGTMDNDARVAIHFSHRIGAIVTTIVVLLLALRLWRSHDSGMRSMAVPVATVLIAQLALGISNIVFHFPLLSTVSHNAVGALLLMVMVTVNYRLFAVESLAASKLPVQQQDKLAVQA